MISDNELIDYGTPANYILRYSTSQIPLYFI
jgi:hypothetical protein